MKLDFFSIGIVLQTCISISNAYTHHRHRQQIHVAPPGKDSGGRLSAGVNPPQGPGSGGTEIIVVTPGPEVVISFPGAGGGGGGPPGDSGMPPPTGELVRNPECGTTAQMYAGGVVQVFSNNFGVSNYNNYESCWWKFEANHCSLSAHCPCVEIPKSWECLGDYLRITTDSFFQSQRFCGGNKPGQPIYSGSDSLSIKFRSDGRITAAGFTCFVRCEGPGMTIPITPPTTCPSSLVFKG